MKRYFSIISYNGKPFHGWQIQPNAPTVQNTIEKLLFQLLQTKIKVVGAGRTDSGVHARNYVLHFDTDKIFQPNLLTCKLNRLLPNEIVFHKIFHVDPKLHARFDAIERTYLYHIDKHKNPFTTHRFAAFYPYLLDIKQMNKTTKLLYDFDDFTAFSKTHTNVKSHLCIVKFAKWKETENQFTFHITANRFLRNMVRSLVGTMVDVGRGKLTINDFQNIFQSRDRIRASTSAPACGLFFTEVLYPIDKITSHKNLCTIHLWDT